MTHATTFLAAEPIIWVGLVGAVALLFVFALAFIATRYKRCPSNRVLVVYGRVRNAQAARCFHGGGAFILPLIQDYAFLSLEPLVIDIPLEGALSKNNIRVNVPATFTVGISTDPVMMNNAAERLLMLDDRKIREQAQDIILGQLRLVIATLSIEEINRDREKFMSLINENVGQEINKVGLDLINVNIRDITDESGYIVAIGQRAAAEAINRAKVEVAEQVRDGEVGQAMAQREMQVTVSERQAETVVGQKQAEREQRVQVSEAESHAVDGENTARATIAASNAKLAKIEAEAKRAAEVARAESEQAIFDAQREEELARLRKEKLAAQEIEKQRIEIAAEAQAEKTRREARGEADAIVARYEAEASGVRQVLEAKAQGYQRLLDACAEHPELAPTLLMIEQLPEIVAEQVKAIQNLQIDKITVWDSGRGGGNGSGTGNGATADFLSGLIGSLPAMHELANMAGIKLPTVLGRVDDHDDGGDTMLAKRAARVNGHAPAATEDVA